MTLKKNIIWFAFTLMVSSVSMFGQGQFEVARLDFNTRSKELAPAFYQNGLVFCSDRRNDFFMSYIDPENNPLTNLYFAEHKKNGKFDAPSLMAKELTTFMFEGPSTFSRDGNIIYFTRSIDVSAGSRNRNRTDTTFGIFMAKFSNGVWSDITGFDFNSAAYKTGYPCLSADGNLLFFCSDAPGGMGGLDLYVSTYRGGRWDKPRNLGVQVNTSKNEVFPFLQEDGRLYFASRGLNQQGDLDIFYTIEKDGVWQKPVALNEPFNTRNDDYGLIFNAHSDTAYFVSDRDGSPDIFAAYSTIPTFTGCAGQQENDYCYVFYESNNDEFDTTAFAYEWDLGDGTQIRALEAEHCFARPDTYLVQLNIVDKLTQDVLLSQATYEFVVEQIEQPYITCPDTVFAGQEIQMSSRETHLKNVNISNYYWDMGDGSRMQGMDTKHSYPFPGTYQIQLGVVGLNMSTPGTTQNNCVIRQIVVLEAKK
jgi:hypothetical protein